MVTSGVPMSDPEVISVDESEEDECLDMSNPMAHVKSQSNQSKPDQGQAKAKNQPRRESVTSSSSEESEVDEQLVPTPIVGKTVDLATESDEDEAFESKQTSNEDDRGSINLGKTVTQPEKSAPDNASKPKVTLSKWASRFLTPRAKPLVLEEPELEPLRDYILDDFGTRFRGNAGEEPQVDDDNEDSDNDDNSKLTVVGAPIVAKAEPKNDKPEKSKSDNPKARKESRYFRKDLSTKCFNCGEIGHMSNACVNTTVMRPCFMCGYRDHKANECPHLLCHRCNQPGHEVRKCPNGRHDIDFCSTCGGSDHESRRCPLRDHDNKNIRCMVCFEIGHLSCIPYSRPADRRIYCPKCCGAHTHDECYDNRGGDNSYYRSSHEDHGRSRYNDDNDSRRNNGRKACFLCNEYGHIAAQCMLNNRGGGKHQRFDDETYNKRKRDDDSDRHSKKRHARYQ
ncbi:hypothetical protein AeMF1_021456 [Aphanomyces euteiches]|nr:hypothetical protein AeMF1_021456 [Aphanomyces euteiches]KAH9195353.1 hypothetical protein AeNC1_002686 [Aphanomyces euteiches]